MDAHLENALTREYSREAALWRDKVRSMLPNVDGPELVRQAKSPKQFLNSVLLKRESSANYFIPLKPTEKYAEPLMDLGVFFDPESHQTEDSGMQVWCSDSAEVLVEIAKSLGYEKASFRYGHHGRVIELGDCFGNREVSELARNMVIEIIIAFDITDQEKAELFRINRDKDIRIVPSDGHSRTI